MQNYCKCTWQFKFEDCRGFLLLAAKATAFVTGGITQPEYRLAVGRVICYMTRGFESDSNIYAFGIESVKNSNEISVNIEYSKVVLVRVELNSRRSFYIVQDLP